jgi:GntR family transcriptional regulator of abcA and norABC
MILNWAAEKDSDQPIYLQLADHIRDQITSGTVKSGEKVPSRRLMVEKLGVSRNTVTTAIDQLVSEGYLVSYPKSGIVVAENWNRKVANWQTYLKRAKHKPSHSDIKFWNDADGLADFGLSTDFNSRPYIVKSMHSALDKVGTPETKKKFSKFGYECLRRSVVKHVKQYGIETDIENVLICPSSILVINPIYESLMSSGSNFLYEKSNLIMAISNIHSIGMNMIPVPMDEYGISVNELKKCITRYKHPMLHVDPTDQAPTGVVMTRKRKRELMDLVDKHQLPVLEIDHLRDAWYNKPFPNPLKSMDKNGNIIYIGSFIRSCPCDLQTSWIIADKYMVEHLSNVLMQNGMKANFLMQIALDEMFRSGDYYLLMEAIRAFIRQRRERALELMDKHLKGVAEWDERNCGFHFWLNFPKLNIRKIFQNAYYSGFHPGYFFDRGDSSHILLCPASIPIDEIEKTIIYIADHVKAELK